MKADDDFAKSMGLEGLDQLRDLLKGAGRAGAERPHPHPYEAPAARPARRGPRFPGAAIDGRGRVRPDLAAARARSEPRGGSGRRARRDGEGARRLSRHRRAPRPPRPAALRDRPEERRRGQPAGDEPADHAGRPAIPARGPPAVRRICPQRADGRRPAARALVRGQGRRLLFAKAEISERDGDPRGARGGDRIRGRPCPRPGLRPRSRSRRQGQEGRREEAGRQEGEGRRPRQPRPRPSRRRRPRRRRPRRPKAPAEEGQPRSRRRRRRRPRRKGRRAASTRLMGRTAKGRA